MHERIGYDFGEVVPMVELRLGLAEADKLYRGLCRMANPDRDSLGHDCLEYAKRLQEAVRELISSDNVRSHLSLDVVTLVVTPKQYVLATDILMQGRWGPNAPTYRTE